MTKTRFALDYARDKQAQGMICAKQIEERILYSDCYSGLLDEQGKTLRLETWKRNKIIGVETLRKNPDGVVVEYTKEIYRSFLPPRRLKVEYHTNGLPKKITTEGDWTDSLILRAPNKGRGKVDFFGEKVIEFFEGNAVMSYSAYERYFFSPIVIIAREVLFKELDARAIAALDRLYCLGM